MFHFYIPRKRQKNRNFLFEKRDGIINTTGRFLPAYIERFFQLGRDNNVQRDDFWNDTWNGLSGFLFVRRYWRKGKLIPFMLREVFTDIDTQNTYFSFFDVDVYQNLHK